MSSDDNDTDTLLKQLISSTNNLHHTCAEQESLIKELQVDVAAMRYVVRLQRELILHHELQSEETYRALVGEIAEAVIETRFPKGKEDFGLRVAKEIMRLARGIA